MGLKIASAGYGSIKLTLECDAASEIFCRGFDEFTSPGGYISCHSAAMDAGWLERQDGERKWLCPECSGK